MQDRGRIAKAEKSRSKKLSKNIGPFGETDMF
jgi:hypothetical protein